MIKDISKYKDDLIFALDIGTRSVVGILGTMIDDKYTVLDFEQRFHTIRAMRDGQVEDIELVSKVCGEVKTALETKHGIKLTRVAIAAAGRALKTEKAVHHQILQEDMEITSEMVRTMEYSAIAKAQDSFYHEFEEEDDTLSEFQCVGYSVLDYKIDGYQIRNLEGHKGAAADVEVIAAFLPFSVVKSLYAVASRCGLEVINLTLEPIAAISVIVPPDVRLLNIAIADVGAGTSDIAISKNGSIVAYDMATIAGDEITESLMSVYLTDFDTAETVKKELMESSADEVEFDDILGFHYSVEKKEVLENIDKNIEELADAISGSILKSNDGPPVAVFLIGGGSQIPGLCQKVSAKLGIPPNRVALGGTQKYKHIDLGFEELKNPEFVTPVGIGTVASQYKGCDFFSITVNGKRIMLMHSGTIRVLDALLLAGIKATSLLGRSSRGITYFVDGEKRTARGTTAVAGQVELNGKVVSLESEVKLGDTLEVTPAENGHDPVIHLSEVPEVAQSEDWDIKVLVNGAEEAGDYVIKNMDKIELMPYEPEAQVSAEPSSEEEDRRTFDEILKTFVDSNEVPETVYVDTPVIINDEKHVIRSVKGEPLKFMNLIEYTRINEEEPTGKLIMKLNGRDASNMDNIKPGDVVYIRWA